MSEAEPGTSQPAAVETCAQCGKELTPVDRVASGDRVFCRGCYATLRAELEQALAQMSTDVNYVNATVGAVLGGAAGVLLWWGFTVLTHIAFGLVAVAIGFLVGLGAVRFSGGKRSGGLQTLSVVVALISYVCATYLVNMTFINKSLAQANETFRVGFPPANPVLLWRVLTADVGIMDLVFLAIVLYQAWKIPKPVALPAAPTA